MREVTKRNLIMFIAWNNAEKNFALKCIWNYLESMVSRDEEEKVDLLHKKIKKEAKKAGDNIAFVVRKNNIVVSWHDHDIAYFKKH